MSSARTVGLVPWQIDPFRRLRTVTNPANPSSTQPTLLVGPESLTQLAGRPGPPGSAALPDVIDGGTPFDSNGA